MIDVPALPDLVPIMRTLVACIFVAFLTAQERAPVASQGPTRPPTTVGTGTQRPKPPGSDRPPLARTRSATGDALDRYAAGDYERAVSVLMGIGSFNPEHAQAWVDAGESADARAHRLLIAGTLALEVVAAKENWPSQVVEWACDAFRAAGPATANEALWLRASIALAEGREMWAFLVKPAQANVKPAARESVAGAPADTGHLAHARARFPTDPYFVMAEAVAAEVKASEPADPLATHSEQTPVASDRISSLLDGPAPLSAAQKSALESALTSLQSLMTNPVVGAEARVRAGFIALRLGHSDRALPMLREAAATATEPFVKYLAHLYAGWTLAHTGHNDDAIAEYRAALDIVPHARSAATLLTSLLVMSDKIADAEALVDREIAVQAADNKDPWRIDLLGDYRNYPALIAQLREAIK
jgi:tetratricopeptide (TPR) repeat protein